MHGAGSRFQAARDEHAIPPQSTPPPPMNIPPCPSPSRHCADTAGQWRPTGSMLRTRSWIVAALALWATLAIFPCAAATDAELMIRGRQIEANLDGFPKRALAELEELVVPARQRRRRAHVTTSKACTDRRWSGPIARRKRSNSPTAWRAKAGPCMTTASSPWRGWCVVRSSPGMAKCRWPVALPKTRARCSAHPATPMSAIGRRFPPAPPRGRCCAMTRR